MIVWTVSVCSKSHTAGEQIVGVLALNRGGVADSSEQRHSPTRPLSGLRRRPPHHAGLC